MWGGNDMTQSQWENTAVDDGAEMRKRIVALTWRKKWLWFPLSRGSEGSVCLLIHWGSESLLWNPSLLRERNSIGVAVTVSWIWSNLTAEERKSSVVSREDRMNGNEKAWWRFVETPAAEGDSLRTRDTGVGLRSVGVVARLTFTVTRTAVASAGPRRPTPGSWLPPWPSPTRPSRSPWAAAGASLLSAQRERETGSPVCSNTSN